MKTLKRTWADISLDDLEYNYHSIRSRLPSGTRYLGVMKADAYGHGAVPISRALADLGAEYLAVSNLEARALLTRRFEPADRRTCHLVLTGKGTEIAEAGAARQRQFFEALYAGVSQSEREQLRAISRKIMDNISHFDCESAK